MTTHINTDFFYQDTDSVLNYLNSIIRRKVPSEGKAAERHVELLRCFANLRYECSGNGYDYAFHGRGMDDYFGMFRTLEIGLRANWMLLFDGRDRDRCLSLLADIDPRNGDWITHEDEDGSEYEEWVGCTPDPHSFDALVPYVAALVSHYERATEGGEVA